MPTGPYAVGRITYDWRDATQQELLAPRAGIHREIFGWIWYPASTQTGAKPADYFPRSWRNALDQQRGWFLTTFLWRDFSRVRAHSLDAPAIAPSQQSYPVVLMRAGAGAEIANYSSLAEDLASHGYIVVGFDAPYRSTMVVFPDGRSIVRTSQNNADLVSGEQQKQLGIRLVQAWSSDMRFALDELKELNASDPSNRLKGRLDLAKVGVFGHSLGGATALQFCHDDSQCKAGADVDGAPLGSVVDEGVKQPFLFLLSDHSREAKSETAPVLTDLHSIYDRLPADRRLWIGLRGAGHFGFTDLTVLLMDIAHVLKIVPMSNKRQIELSRNCLRSFFDVYLKGAPPSELGSLSGYQEIEYSH
ncbi:alpha/beta hydrolase family protein [Occallatibacter savannae]|uniref:alpha/beta hydrolase family protein n=1 Tax=Occallatibacter savannae TaxID=1002691 RepID=UPI00194DF3D7|nr:hypothetical protein [Occallatibacter savannae]